MISSARGLVEANGVPGRRENKFGSVWLAHTQDELRSLGPYGISGLYIDNEFEAERVIKRVVRKAIKQLPLQQSSLLYIDWDVATDEFFQAVHRRLSKLGDDDPQIAGVIVRRTMFAADVVPAYSFALIENPKTSGVARSCPVTIALLSDDVGALRDPAGPCAVQVALWNASL